MADATPTAPVNDSVTAVDIESINILPLANSITYSLLTTWASGRQQRSTKTVSVTDFAACLASFCQATPKKKFLTWLQSSNYESNLTIA